MNFFVGTFNYQGEVSTLKTHIKCTCSAQAHHIFTAVLARKYDTTFRHMKAYFNGEKDNYKIEEVNDGDRISNSNRS